MLKWTAQSAFQGRVVAADAKVEVNSTQQVFKSPENEWLQREQVSLDLENRSRNELSRVSKAFGRCKAVSWGDGV